METDANILLLLIPIPRDELDRKEHCYTFPSSIYGSRAGEKVPKMGEKNLKCTKMGALLVNEATLRNRSWLAARAELAAIAHGARLAAVSDMAEELTTGLRRGCANWNTTRVSAT